MKWCQEHWDGLRAEVVKQGLGALVPDSPEKAAAATVGRASGDVSIDTFDPLMGAMWAIVAFIGQQSGLGFMMMIAMEGCTVCEADKVHSQRCTVNGPGCTESYARFFPDAVKDQVKMWEDMNDGK